MKSYLNETFLETSAETLRAIAHPYRIAIIDLLHTHGQLSVTDIYTRLDIEQAVASHHLRIMKSQDVVVVKRDGKNSFYALSSPEFYEIVRSLTKVI